MFKVNNRNNRNTCYLLAISLRKNRLKFRNRHNSLTYSQLKTRTHTFEYQTFTQSFHKQLIRNLLKQPPEVFYEKKLFLKFSQNSQENTYIGVYLLITYRLKKGNILRSIPHNNKLIFFPERH